MSLPSLALLAGGLATRLGAVTEKTPKSLLEVAGHPFIYHQLKLIRRLGVTEVVFCLGHLGERIKDYVGDGSDFQLSASYSFDGESLIGTGGALKKALPKLRDPFFVLYGDSYLDLPLQPIAEAYKKSGKQGLMTVYKNEGRFDKSNVEFEAGKIAAYSKSQATLKMKHIDYGLGVLSKEALGAELESSFDLADFYGKLVRKGQLAGYEVSQRFYEIGSAAGLAETHAFLSSQ